MGEELKRKSNYEYNMQKARLLNILISLNSFIHEADKALKSSVKFWQGDPILTLPVKLKKETENFETDMKALEEIQWDERTLRDVWASLVTLQANLTEYKAKLNKLIIGESPLGDQLQRLLDKFESNILKGKSLGTDFNVLRKPRGFETAAGSNKLPGKYPGAGPDGQGGIIYHEPPSYRQSRIT